MLSQRTKKFFAALLTTAIVASCGGSDSSSRQRNVAMDGKQQCLSDDDTKINTSGTAVLAFCATATTYKTLAEGDAQTLSDAIRITSGNTAEFKPAPGQNTIRVLSFDSKGIQVGEDVVTTILPDCSTGAACAVGDTGPGGGIVVYDAGSKESWGQYIEMARKGWYDPATGGDPTGAFACEDKNLETTPDLGSGKVNTDKFVKECEATASYGQRAHTLVDNYKSGVNSSIDDWAIPSAWDLYEIDNMSADVWKKLELRGTYSTSTETSYARGQMTLYTYGETQNPRQRFYGPDFGTTAKSIWNQFMVRPVRYFSASGEVKPSIKVVGVMDIPTTTTEVTTTTEMPETTTLAPNTLPEPVGGNVSINDETGYISVSWDVEYPYPSGDLYRVIYKKTSGGGDGTADNAYPDVKFKISDFEPDTEYKFKVGRVGDNNQVFWGEPFLAIPNQSKINISPPTDEESGTTNSPTPTPAPTNEVPTPTPAPTNEVPTPTVVQTTNSPISTTVNKLDCTVAPKVSYTPENPTSDDTITFTVTHPCFGIYEQQYVIFGRAEKNDEGTAYWSASSSTGVNGEKWTKESRLNPGLHTFLFRTSLEPEAEKALYSESRQVEVSVAEGATPSKNACDNDSITVENSILTITCPSIWSQAVIESGKNRAFLTAIDDEKLTSDLSNIGSGWRHLNLLIVHGLDFFLTQVTVCIKSCELPSSFEPFTVSLDNDNATVTAPTECASGLSISQMYKSSENLYKRSNQEVSYSVEPTTVPLNGSTGALLITREDCEKGGILTAFASLERTVTQPTPDDVNPPVDEKVATIGLLEITRGATDLPVGEVAGGVITTSSAATSVALTPEVVTGLLALTVEDSKVELVEVSLDGISWKNALIGSFSLPATAETMSVRLTAASGKQTVIKQSIDRSVPVVVSQNDEVVSTTSDSSSSGSGILSFWWVLLVLLVLIGGFFATKKKRTA